VRLARNLGHAGAAAAGVTACRGELVALVNNDAVPDPDWLEQALLAFDDPRVGSVATRLVRYDRPEILDSAGDGYTVVGHAFKGREGELDPREEANREVFSACAAAAILRRAAYDAAGGLRPDLEAYYDDVDLGFRLRLAGYSSLYVPAARCRHRVSTSYGRGSFRQLALTSRNQALVWWSDMPVGLLVRYLPEHALFCALQVVSRLFQGGLLPLLAGKAQALTRLPLWWRLRREAQARRVPAASRLSSALETRWLRPGITDLRRRWRGSRS
jgi:GT2 family glycosyltransferase